MDKPFSQLNEVELQKLLDELLNRHVLLERDNWTGRHFIGRKRPYVMPAVWSIYDEIFATRDIEPVFIEKVEMDRLDKFAKDFVSRKIVLGERGWSRDQENGIRRVANGSYGHLAVLKSMGGTIEDMPLEIGESRDFNEPDLRDWLEGNFDVGVKTAAISDPKSKAKNRPFNLPLVLDYKNFTSEHVAKWKEVCEKYGDRPLVESQIIVGTREVYRQTKDMPKRILNQIKCFIIGVASPPVIMNGASTAFTLDKNAADPQKPGGAKAGFYNLHLTEHFKTKEELIKILKKPEYQSVPYDEIKNYVTVDVEDWSNREPQ